MKKFFLFTFFVLSMSSCSMIKLEYEDFDSCHITWEETFSQTPDSYYLYFYSAHCSHCKAIKDEVLKFANTFKDNFYFIKQSASFVYSKKGESNIGVDNWEDFTIVGIPSLCLLESHRVVEYYKGEDEIIGYIKNL